MSAEQQLLQAPAPTPTFRISVNLRAEHRAWLKRRAVEKSLREGGHDSMSEVVAELIERAVNAEGNGK